MLEMAPLIQVVNPVDISPILNRIQNAYQIPVFVENDLNMEVMGEFLSLSGCRKKATCSIFLWEPVSAAA